MSKLNVQELQAALLSNVGAGKKSGLFSKETLAATKSIASKFTDGFVGMMPVTTKKFDNTVQELNFNDAVASARITSLINQLQEMGLPVEEDFDEIEEDAIMILAQYNAAKEAKKQTEKEEKKAARSAKAAEFRSKMGLENVQPKKKKKTPQEIMDEIQGKTLSMDDDIVRPDVQHNTFTFNGPIDEEQLSRGGRSGFDDEL